MFFGSALDSAPARSPGSDYTAQANLRIAGYNAQETQIQAAMKQDAQSGGIKPLLQHILKDADLRARSATLKRYLQSSADDKSILPGEWLLNQVTDLFRSTANADRKAAILKPQMSSPASASSAEQLVDLTGLRGWNDGTAEELSQIARDMENYNLVSSNITDEQRRRDAIRQLDAYLGARIRSSP
jgi:hypothetical protein